MSGPETLRGARAQHRANLAAVSGMRPQHGSGAHIYHKGPMVALHVRPLPALEAYEAWFADWRANADSRGKTPMDARKLRRAATMRRQGSNFREIATAINIDATVVSKWLALLPEELRP